MSARLFVAIRPPADVRAALLAAMGGISAARWQDDGQLHLTLRFCGDVDARTADTLIAALEAIRFHPFPIALEGLGTFTRRGRAHTVYAAVPRNRELAALQQKVERACTAAGLPPAEHGFVPHVTLARLNSGAGPLEHFLTRAGGRAFGNWVCDSFVLFESHLRAEGSHYEPVRVFRKRG